LEIVLFATFQANQEIGDPGGRLLMYPETGLISTLFFSPQVWSSRSNQQKKENQSCDKLSMDSWW
jgi:hypothetical protein